jgi:hypothetical protein
MPTPAVDENEMLFRQVKSGGDPPFFDSVRKPVVHRTVFLPSNDDADRLSFIRSRFRSPGWSAYRPEKPCVRFRLACLRIPDLLQVADDCGIQQLNYQTTPDGLDERHGEPWAHGVIAEINRTDYDSDQDAKKRMKEWALGVADRLAKTDVIGPFQEPRDCDQYRPNGGHECFAST